MNGYKLQHNQPNTNTNTNTNTMGKKNKNKKERETQQSPALEPQQPPQPSQPQPQPQPSQPQPSQPQPSQPQPSQPQPSQPQPSQPESKQKNNVSQSSRSNSTTKNDDHDENTNNNDGDDLDEEQIRRPLSKLKLASVVKEGEEEKLVPSVGLQFFDQQAAAQKVKLKEFFARGERQLETLKKSLLTPAEENQECLDFLRWVDGCTFSHGKKVQQVKAIHKSLNTNELGIPAGYSAEIIDFSPNRRQDDEMYSRNHNIWLQLTRGCAMLLITHPDGSQQYYWAVRANRKFTGHEDDSSCDSALYTIEGPPAEYAVITLKENGQVVHLSAREVTFGETKKIFVFLGSKHVHLGIPFTNDRAEFLRLVRLFVDSRHALVHDMAAAIVDYVTEDLVKFLAEYHLVLNSEHVKPVSSGPIDNRRVHHLQKEMAFAFSFTVNALHPPKGMELCLEPLYSFKVTSSPFVVCCCWWKAHFVPVQPGQKKMLIFDNCQINRSFFWLLNTIFSLFPLVHLTADGEVWLESRQTLCHSH